MFTLCIKKREIVDDFIGRYSRMSLDGFFKTAFLGRGSANWSSWVRDPYTPPVQQIAELFAFLKKVNTSLNPTLYWQNRNLWGKLFEKVVRRGTSDTLSPLYKYLQGSSSIYSPNLCRSISYFAESQVCVAQHWWPPLPLLFSGCIMPVLLGGDRRRKSPCTMYIQHQNS